MKMVATLFALALTASTAFGAGPAASGAAAPSPVAANPAVVYYFHGTSRCQTCRTIEAYAQEAVSGAFSADLAERRLEWKVVNVDEPANEHFVDDFKLYTRSLVVVDAKDPKRFKILDRVWQLTQDKAAFRKYVEDEIRAFRRS